MMDESTIRGAANTHEAWFGLTMAERQVLNERYGIQDGFGHDVAEVAERLHWSESQIRYVEKEAIAALGRNGVLLWDLFDVTVSNLEAQIQCVRTAQQALPESLTKVASETSPRA